MNFKTLFSIRKIYGEEFFYFPYSVKKSVLMDEKFFCSFCRVVGISEIFLQSF